jgi:hypothetical protein
MNRLCPRHGGTEEGVKIQINSDKNVAVDTKVISFVTDEVNRALKVFAGKLTRVEVHLSDVNSSKFGTHDKRCLIEARPARHRPVTVRSGAPTVRAAVGDALTKLRSSLRTFFGRLGKRHEDKTSIAEGKRPPMGRRRSPATEEASPASATPAKVGRATPRSTKTSLVTARKSVPDESLGQGRGPKKKGVYQARRKSWPAR